MPEEKQIVTWRSLAGNAVMLLSALALFGNIVMGAMFQYEAYHEFPSGPDVLGPLGLGLIGFAVGWLIKKSETPGGLIRYLRRAGRDQDWN